MYQIIFEFENGGDNVVIDANKGEDLLELAKKVNVAIDAPCSGNVSCGKCKVLVTSGEVESNRTNHISQEDYNKGYRLACNSTVCGDATLQVPDIASAYQSRLKVADLSSYEEVRIFNQIKSDILESGIPFENDMEILSVSMNEPTLDDTMPDNERLHRALSEVSGLEREQIHLPFYVLRKLPDVAREAGFKLKCPVSRSGDKMYVYDVVPETENAPVKALVVDIGTTTVAALIVDMSDGTILAKGAAGNGQIRYGADVINRIIESTKKDGVKKLQRAIIEDTLNPMIDNMCKSINADPQSIYRMTVASNTTMNHLFAGINADFLRQEPYIPAFFEADTIRACDLGLDINPHAQIKIAPNIGSYVGGDITAGALASMIWNRPEISLFVDLGTNGEIVYGNSDFLMSCACSAGPAFEGGDIRCGMRATDGAIESCVIDEQTMEPTLSIIGEEGQKPVGLCGSGIIDVISELFRTGIISPNGHFAREGDRITKDKHGITSYVISFKGETDSGRSITISEVDIDNFIRAKGAIFSAISTMLKMLDMEVSFIERVYVAGGIGSGINIENAIKIGMFPNIPVDKYTYIGNSSLSGAYAMTMSTAAEDKVTEIGRSMTYVELSTHPGYMDEFIGACFLPHTDASLFEMPADA